MSEILENECEEVPFAAKIVFYSTNNIWTPIFPSTYYQQHLHPKS